MLLLLLLLWVVLLVVLLLLLLLVLLLLLLSHILVHILIGTLVIFGFWGILILLPPPPPVPQAFHNTCSCIVQRGPTPSRQTKCSFEPFGDHGEAFLE